LPLQQKDERPCTDGGMGRTSMYDDGNDDDDDDGGGGGGRGGGANCIFICE